MYTWILVFTVFLKNRTISSKIKRSKVTDYAALILNLFKYFHKFHSVGEVDPVGVLCFSA